MASNLLSFKLSRDKLPAKIENLPDFIERYRGRKLSAEEEVERIRLSVEVFFGYASVSRSIVDDCGLNPHEIAAKLGCIAVEGVIMWGFLRDKPRELVFGEKPDKKTLKKMVKELKTCKNRSKST